MKIGILGAGTWGSALANAFVDKHEVTLWSRFDSEVDLLTRLTLIKIYLEQFYRLN